MQIIVEPFLGRQSMHPTCVSQCACDIYVDRGGLILLTIWLNKNKSIFLFKNRCMTRYSQGFLKVEGKPRYPLKFFLLYYSKQSSILYETCHKILKFVREFFRLKIMVITRYSRYFFIYFFFLRPSFRKIVTMHAYNKPHML